METTGIGSVLRGYVDRLASGGIVLSSEAWLAGGAIRRAVCGTPIEEGDFDIYVKDIKDFVSKVKGPVLRPKHSFDNKVTMETEIGKLKVQIHHGYGTSISEVLKGFDFTCCQLATDGSKLYYLGDALTDAKTYRLIYTDVAGHWTVARAFRLQAMGFQPNKKTLNQMQVLASKVAKIKKGNVLKDIWEIATSAGRS